MSGIFKNILIVLISLLVGVGAYFSGSEPMDEVYEDNTYICDIQTDKAKPWYAEKININSADITLLCTISGVGEKKAEAIIAYRQEKGGFKSIEEIMNVKGIGEKTFEAIKDFICV